MDKSKVIDNKSEDRVIKVKALVAAHWMLKVIKVMQSLVLNK